MVDSRKIPLAWKIVTFNKRRLILSLAGIAFSVMTMFLELGFYNGFNDSQVNLPPIFNGDLVIMHKTKIHMMKTSYLKKAILHQTLAFEEVEEAIPIYVGMMSLKNSTTDMVYDIGVMAFPADSVPLKVSGFTENQNVLKNKNSVLFDSLSRSIYGKIKEGDEIELSDKKFLVGGLVELGPNFTRNGWVIMSDSAWLNLGVNPHKISFGLLIVKPGTDLETLKSKIAALNPGEVTVMTPREVRQRDTHFWTTATPLGIVFGTGLIIGFLIGVMICYQILFNEITDHMAQYATLKAVGFSNAFLIGTVMKIAILYSLLGFLPGLLGGWVLYHIIEYFTRIDMFLTGGRIILICIFTVLMSVFSGLLAVRKVMRADPADVF